MSKVVQFLETLACGPADLTAEEFAGAVARADIADAMKQALLARDIDALRAALGGRAEMLCMIVPAENDEPVEDEPSEDDDQERNDAQAF